MSTELLQTFIGFGPIELLALFLTITALFSLINYHFIKLPITVGVMLVGLISSIIIYIAGLFNPVIVNSAEYILRKINFDRLLLDGMLSALLFAGAIQVNLSDLIKQKWTILILSTVSVIGSTFIIGVLISYLMQLLSIDLPFIYCLLFGALISPTDPIAVLAILQRVGISKSLLTKITGESLFNDGVGVVIFTVIAGIALSGQEFSLLHASTLFLHEAVGGILYGLVLGYFGYLLMRTVDNINVEVLLSLALVIGGYRFASVIDVSGPLAIVITGLIVGNQSSNIKTSMSLQTRQAMEVFWKIIDELLNAILFVLVGLEVLLVAANHQVIMAGLFTIIIVLFSRFVSISIPITLMRPFRSFSAGAISIMTWGGLRGGLSVAMALSLPDSQQRNIILGLTYFVVIFSLIVQSLSIGKLTRRLQKQQPAQENQ